MTTSIETYNTEGGGVPADPRGLGVCDGEGSNDSVDWLISMLGGGSAILGFNRSMGRIIAEGSSSLSPSSRLVRGFSHLTSWAPCRGLYALSDTGMQLVVPTSPTQVSPVVWLKSGKTKSGTAGGHLRVRGRVKVPISGCCREEGSQTCARSTQEAQGRDGEDGGRPGPWPPSRGGWGWHCFSFSGGGS